MGVVRLITQAIEGRDPVGDAQTVHRLEGLGAERDRITTALRRLLNTASSEGSKSDGGDLSGLIDDAKRLLARVGDANEALQMSSDQP